MNWKLLATGLVLVLALVWVLAKGFGQDPRALPSTLEGRKATDFQLETLDGDMVSLESLRGNPVVLNFWSTWCNPCIYENPILKEAARTYDARGVVFLGVLYGDDPDRARAYLQREGAAYPTLVDPSQAVVIDYGVGGVPETFFISREGIIVDKVTGPVSRQQLKELVEKILSAGGAS